MATAKSVAGESMNEGRLGALRHGLAVFDMFDMDRQTITPIEISRELGLHKSTASRIVSNLVLSGYLTPATNGSGFRLSGKITRLGAIAAAEADLSSIATKHLQALAEDVGETCHVGVLEGNDAVTVVLVNGTYSVRLNSWVGKRNPAANTATGKALLAGLSEATIDMLYPHKSLPVLTEHSIGDLGELKRQLALVREHGFAVDDEEMEPGLRCVAAPITDHTSDVVAAVTIAGASSRLPMTGIDHYAAKVKDTATSISIALGSPNDSCFFAGGPLA